MTFSSRHAISTHILMVLACCPNTKASSDMLAGSVNTNSVVIRRLLAKLRDAGLVTVQKGADGGYTLAKCPKQISLWDVFQIVEELPLFNSHTSPPSEDCAVGKCVEKILKEVYKTTENAVRQSLSSSTLADLVDCVEPTKGF